MGGGESIDGTVININKLERPIKTQLPGVIISSSFSNRPTYTSFENTVSMITVETVFSNDGESCACLIKLKFQSS